MIELMVGQQRFGRYHLRVLEAAQILFWQKLNSDSGASVVVLVGVGKVAMRNGQSGITSLNRKVV